MIIDGDIELSDTDVVIGHNLSEEEFLASSLSVDSTNLVHNGEYRSYSIGRHLVCGTLFAVSIFFESGRLKSIHLSPIDEAVTSFEDVTDSILERQACENREWIKRECGGDPPLSFDWGKIESTRDRRSWNSLIVFTYFADTAISST